MKQYFKLFSLRVNIEDYRQSIQGVSGRIDHEKVRHIMKMQNTNHTITLKIPTS